MPASITHNSWLIEPPPGAVFQQTMIGGRVMLELMFERGKEAECIAYMRAYVDTWEAQQEWIDPRIRAAVKSAANVKKGDPAGATALVRTAQSVAARGAAIAAGTPAALAPAVSAAPGGAAAAAATAAAVPAYAPEAVCKDAECGQPFGFHEHVRPHPCLKSGCGAFQP